MNNKGVTLIELLIVIVVIGIIATFAVPAVGDIITNSEKDAVLQDARSLADQARLYCGQGLCSAEQEGATGLTWSDLDGMGGLDVFDEAKYLETAGTNTDVILIKTDGVWTVNLSPGTGGYYFASDTNADGFVDPVTATRDNVYTTAP